MCLSWMCTGVKLCEAFTVCFSLKKKIVRCMNNRECICILWRSSLVPHSPWIHRHCVNWTRSSPRTLVWEPTAPVATISSPWLLLWRCCHGNWGRSWDHQAALMPFSVALLVISTWYLVYFRTGAFLPFWYKWSRWVFNMGSYCPLPADILSLGKDPKQRQKWTV